MVFGTGAERLWSTILHDLISLLYAKEKKREEKGKHIFFGSNALSSSQTSLTLSTFFRPPFQALASTRYVTPWFNFIFPGKVKSNINILQ